MVIGGLRSTCPYRGPFRFLHHTLGAHPLRTDPESVDMTSAQSKAKLTPRARGTQSTLSTPLFRFWQRSEKARSENCRPQVAALKSFLSRGGTVERVGNNGGDIETWWGFGGSLYEFG